MNKSQFEREMHRAAAMRAAGDRPDYWDGYERGLRRAYHGERFGSPEEHGLWLSQADSDDEQRRERGQGYRDGLATGGVR
jgi:hypothetical protein